MRFPRSKKALQRYRGFVNCYINYISRIVEKLNPFYKLWKAGVPINKTSELKKTIDSVNKALSDACELALQQPIPGKHLVSMTDASFRSVGYALMIESNPDQKTQSKENLCTCRMRIKNLLPAQLKTSIYLEKFCAICMVFVEFAPILWEASEATIFLTDNRSVTRFFQTKSVPPSLAIACDYVLQFSFKISHIAGSVKTAAGFLSRLEVRVT